MELKEFESFYASVFYNFGQPPVKNASSVMEIFFLFLFLFPVSLESASEKQKTCPRPIFQFCLEISWSLSSTG